MSERIRIAAVTDVPLGTGKEFVAKGRIIALFHTESGFYAIDGICAHAGGPLGEGELNGCVVTCPWHGWQYDVATGAHCLSSQIRQAVFPVQVAGEDVYVEMP